MENPSINVGLCNKFSQCTHGLWYFSYYTLKQLRWTPISTHPFIILAKDSAALICNTDTRTLNKSPYVWHIMFVHQQQWLYIQPRFKLCGYETIWCILPYILHTAWCIVDIFVYVLHICFLVLNEKDRCWRKQAELIFERKHFRGQVEMVQTWILSEFKGKPLV